MKSKCQNRLSKEQQIYPHKHRSGNVTWVVNVGKKINGKEDLRRFKSEQDAKHFQSECKTHRPNSDVLTDLQGVARHEVLATLGKLKVVGATLNEAVDFFLEFGRPPRPGVSIEQTIEVFLEGKRQKKRSEKYQNTIEHTTLRPFGKLTGLEQPVASIT